MKGRNAWNFGRVKRCLGLGLLGLAGFALAQDAPAPAQDKTQPPAKADAPEKANNPGDPPPAEAKPEGEKTDDTRIQLFGQGFARIPKTVPEFFAAIDYEIETNNLSLAGKLISLLLSTNPSEADLAKLAKDAPLTRIIAYRRFTKWDDNANLNNTYRKNLEELIKRTSEAQLKSLKDPQRMRAILDFLEGDKREFAHGVSLLGDMGALAVPALVDVMLQIPDAKDRIAIIRALRKLGPETLAPIVAGLSVPDDLLKIELISILVDRKVTQAIPELWILAGTAQNPGVRTTALNAIASIRSTEISRMESPGAALTNLARDHYNQKFSYPNPAKVEIWRFDEKSGKIVPGIPGTEYPNASQVEEFLGQRYANAALRIDKTNREAQKVILALTIDKGMARIKDTELSRPLGFTNPKLADFLDSADPTILMDLLEQAIANRKTLEVLALVRALGQQAEPRASQPWFARKPLLLKALSYGDRRVEWASAQAFLRSAEASQAAPTNQIIEVLRRSITGWVNSPQAAISHSRTILATDDTELGRRLMGRIKETGREGILVTTGGDLLRRLNRASDIDLIILDPNLPGYGTASLVAQLRSDRHFGKLPLVILGLAKSTDVRDIILEYSDIQRRLDILDNELTARDERFATIKSDYQAADESIKRDAANVRGGPNRKADLEEALKVRRDELERSNRERIERSSQAFSFTNGQANRREELIARKKVLLDAFETIQEKRYVQLEAQWGSLPATIVVHGHDAAAPRILETTLVGWISQLKLPSLTEEERQYMAETAVFQLARMADGAPPGYDIKPATDELISVLRSTNLPEPTIVAAARAISHIPGLPAQLRLVEGVMDSKRSPLVRAGIADNLVMHMRRYTILIPEAKREELVALASQSSNDPILREKLGALVGILKPSVANTGERLLKISSTPK